MSANNDAMFSSFYNKLCSCIWKHVSTTINWVLQQASTRDGEANVGGKKKNTTVHENNPHQTYKLI